MLGWIVLLLASSLSGQVAPTLRYRVLMVDKPDQTISALNASADQGYRLLLPGPVFILRLESTPPDTYHYIAMSKHDHPVQFVNWLNDQGAHGYRWVPRAGAMEKEPHPKNYEYATPGLFSGWAPTKSAALSDLVGQGYHVLGLTTFRYSIGPPPTAMFFERELGSKPKPMRITEGAEIEIADATRAGNVLKQINALAEKGYRYVGPYASRKGGGLAVLMQKCGQECEGPFEYHYFDVHNMDQVAKELNDQGKDGFRVVPEALTSRPHVLERGGAKKGTYTYHVLQVKDPVALEQALNASEQEGYEPIGYVWRIGARAAAGYLFLAGGSPVSEVFLLLEKAPTASATP